MAHRRALRTLITGSAERLKSFLCMQSLPEHFVFWTICVANEKNSAFVIPTIMGECATHRNCSQFFHTCLQRIIGSCRDGEFRDG